MGKKLGLLFLGAVILVVIGMGCCQEQDKKTLKPRKWAPTEYVSCMANVKNLPPMTIAVNIKNTNLPFGRYDGFTSNRPHLITVNGTDMDIGSDLVPEGMKEQTSVNLYSTTDEYAFLGLNWEDPDHGMLEEFKQEIILDPTKYRLDVIRKNLKTGQVVNLTKNGENISFYNVGGELLNNGKILFAAFVNDVMNSFYMNMDGSNKTTAINSVNGFAYGFAVSPDNKRYSFHSDYRVYIGDMITGIEIKVETPCKFNFMPQWSPDSEHISFFCGESNNSPDIFVANKLGQDVRFVASRNGFSGTVPIIQGYDFHGGGSDLITWGDNTSIVYAANQDGAVELFKINIHDNTKVRLTESSPGTLNNFPSSKNDYLVYTTSSQIGKRDVWYLQLSNPNVKYQVTDMSSDCAAAYPKWSEFNEY